MRKLLLVCLSLSIGLLGFAQFNRAPVSKQSKSFAVKKVMAQDETNNPNAAVKPGHKSVKTISEEEIGSTVYDLQSNSSTQNRLYKFDDGTIGATWTMANVPTAYADRGTGYNYFNGTAWGAQPTARIENVKTGWPSYAAYGANGEAVVCHKSGTTPLVLDLRSTKGTGTWAFSDIAAPTGATGYLWPRMVTSGTNHSTINVLALTAPTANSGSVYQGLDGALLYSRSTDGGVTWDKNDVMLPGLTSAEYWGFSGDTYDWAEPKGNTLAFLMGENGYDLILMKSTDGGDTWTKTVIWEHPVPHWNGTDPTADTFYCPDGSHSVAIDNNGICHVAFGINRAHADDAGSYWFPGVGGVGYWNETMPTWTGGNQWEALDPSTLPEANLIGYALDLNGNGTWDILDVNSIAKYYMGTASMPQLTFSQDGRLILTFTMIMEGFDNGTQNYRHVWCRGSNNNGTTWGDFIDITGDILHMYDECVFPSVAANTDADNLYVLFQADEEPGLSVRGDEDAPTTNRMVFMTVTLDSIIPPVLVPPPTALQLTLNYNDVTLNWTAPTGTGLQGYDVYRNGTKINTSLITTTTYQDLDLGYGAYSYCVKAVYETATSDCSNTVQTTVLLKPLNLTADANGYTVTLNWDAPFKGLTGYNVYRDDVKITDTPITVNTFTEDVAIGSFDYTVTAVYSEGESVASDPVTVVINSINDPIAKSIKVYPNPVKDQLNVVSGAEINRIVITNHVGQIVFDGVVNNNNFRLNTSNYQNGIYMVKIYTANGSTIVKMIVE